MALPTHHPDPSHLLAYATGTGDRGEELIVATHLAFCPPCRREVARLEGLGGALLAEVPPVALPPRALDEALALLRRPVAQTARPRGGDPRIPEPLRSVLGPPEHVPWTHVPGGSRVVALPEVGASARLAVLAPGTEIPLHTHSGRELLLVVTGSFDDGLARYAAGDVSVADDAVRHDLRVLPGEACMALVVRDRPIRSVHADGTVGSEIPGV